MIVHDRRSDASARLLLLLPEGAAPRPSGKPLQADGFDVTVAATTGEALDLLTRLKFACFVADASLADGGLPEFVAQSLQREPAARRGGLRCRRRRPGRGALPPRRSHGLRRRRDGLARCGARGARRDRTAARRAAGAGRQAGAPGGSGGSGRRAAAGARPGREPHVRHARVAGPGGRDQGPLARRPLGASGAARRVTRGGDGPHRPGDRGGAPGRPAARHRHDLPGRRHSLQGGSAHRRRVRAGQAARGHRRIRSWSRCPTWAW